MPSRRVLLQYAALTSIALPYLSKSARADDAWPARELHAICGFPPGSGADVFVRFYGKKLEDKLGKTVITENKVGAFGNIATEYVARSKPDGYTLFIAPGSSFLAAAPSLFKKLSFDPINDFEHVTTLSKLPFILIVSGDSPYKSVADLTAYLKQQGDKASYASVANTGLVSSELYKANFGLTTVEVCVSAVFDGIGKDTFLRSLECLDPFGTLVNFGNASGARPLLDIRLLGVRGSQMVTRMGMGFLLQRPPDSG